MAVDLVSYTGNAGLGLGANPDISAPANLAVLNNTMRDISLLDNERNLTIFKQKVADRNNLEQLILNNQVSTGEIQPEDQKYFDEAKNKVEEAYDKWGGNFNDTKGFRKYQEAVTNLQNTATHAQTRWAGLKKLETERSQQTLPRKIKDYDDWIEKQKSLPFGSQITPYQQIHDFSIDDLNKVPPQRKTILAGDAPGRYYEVSTVDYDDILKFKRDQYIDDQNARDSIDKFTDKFFSYDPVQLKKTIDAANERLHQYNQERGVQQGQPGYAPDIQFQEGPNGNPIITDPKTELAAKWALSTQPSFVTKIPKVNKDILKNQIDLAKLHQGDEKIKLQVKKLGLDQQKTNAYVRHMNAATGKILQQANEEGTDITKMYNDFIDNIQPAKVGITETESGKKVGNLDAIMVDELPQGYQFINGAIVNEKSGKVTPGQLIPFSGAEKKDKIRGNVGRPYYIPRYVNPKTGEKITPNSDFINGTFKQWKAGGYQGTKDDMMRTFLKNGALELLLQGQNGVVNYSAMSQAARVLNNLGGSKKGQENIINPPETSPNEPDTPDDSDNQ